MLSDAMSSGDLRAQLEALRDRLASEIESADSSSAVASLARQLTVVLEKLEGLPSAERSNLDELEKRRADRRSTAVAKRSASGE